MLSLFVLGACKGKRDLLSGDTSSDSGTTDGNDDDNVSTTPSRFLYVASGACYGGDATAGATASGSNIVSRYNIDTGAFDSLIVDYNAISTSDQPVGIVDWDADNLLVLVENGGTRRVDKVNKKTGAVLTYLSSSVLNTQVRSLVKLADGSLYVSKGTAIEKFNANRVRVTAGTNPYVNAPAGNCATSTTMISGVDTLSNGRLFYAHAGATPNNRVGIIASTGYVAAGDCIQGVTVTTTTSLPTAVLRVKDTEHVLVASGSSVSASNRIDSYALASATTAVIPAPVQAYTDFSYVTAPSAMIQDQSTGLIYVANARATHNSIEAFTYDTTTKLLTRQSPSFLVNSIYTRCVSGLAIGN